MVRKADRFDVQCLDRRLQCPPIVLLEFGFGNDDPSIWIDTQQITVVGGVVQNRETDAVSDIRVGADAV
jgi:hypothetical protein